MYKVIIVEDDPMVAAINRQYTEAAADFVVTGVFKNGEEAAEYLQEESVDLIILDYYTPRMTGEEFIDRIRAMKIYPAIIMVTSANDSEIVKRLLSRGVLDYLVKPFEFRRFQSALERFRKRQRVMEEVPAGMMQNHIDELFRREKSEQAERESLPKGLNEATMNIVRSFIEEHPQEMFTCEQVAAQVHLSRITVSRYMSYLLEKGSISSTVDYQTGGRPCVRYQRR